MTVFDHIRDRGSNAKDHDHIFTKKRRQKSDENENGDEREIRRHDQIKQIQKGNRGHEIENIDIGQKILRIFTHFAHSLSDGRFIDFFEIR
jgi:hypothetical protein